MCIGLFALHASWQACQVYCLAPRAAQQIDVHAIVMLLSDDGHSSVKHIERLTSIAMENSAAAANGDLLPTTVQGAS